MTRRRSDELRRGSVAVLVAVLLSAGCGSAAGQGTGTVAPGQASSPGPQATVSAQTASGSHGASGIAGQTVALVCGGPSSENGCPRHPVLATVDVRRMPSQQRIATARTDGSGHFRFDLPPGDYELQARASSHQIWARAVAARVLLHQIRHTTIVFVPRHPLPVAPGSTSG
jgi:hypothetical protein